MHEPATTTSDREIVMTRVFDAPRAQVFAAWVEPRHLVHWWGPRGFTNTYQEIDVRPGGVCRFVMHGPDGTDYPNLIVYEEIVAPERLVYAHGSGEADGPQQFHVTVNFDDQGGKTLLTMRTVFATAEQREATVAFGAVELGHQTLDKLAEYLAAQG